MNIPELTIKELIKNRTETLSDLALIKRKIAKKYKVPCLSNIELLKEYHKLIENRKLDIRKSQIKKLKELLRIRRIRSLSGIAVVSVLTKPYPCPGKCIYCPTQKGIPKSYLDNEPAVMRAVLTKFNPYLQVQTRLKSLEMTGHPTDKIELIIIGGTWSFLKKNYQTWFIKKCFEACNKKTSRNLKQAQKRNEKAKHRIIGITIETRPDYINKKEIKRLRKLGVTRVELGVQNIYDDVLKLNRRGHKIKDTILATKLLKDAGFKICYHLMPNLPGSNLKKDEKTFDEIFQNPDFQPDLLKIYPLAVLKEAPLYNWWKKKKYRPYKDKELMELLKRIKKKIPYYCRIQRLQRDIPAQSIVVGPLKISNLRQILAKESKKEGWQCKCIRCREIREKYNPKEKLELFREDYDASDGREIFLSFENKNRQKLYSLLRLRIPSQVLNNRKHFLLVLENSAIIREIHTYGFLHSLNYKKRISVISPQHKGLGKKLIKEAEKIIKKEFALKKMSVISGVGARKYFRKLGYKLKNTYMIKRLNG